MFLVLFFDNMVSLVYATATSFYSSQYYSFLYKRRGTLPCSSFDGIIPFLFQCNMLNDASPNIKPTTSFVEYFSRKYTTPTTVSMMKCTICHTTFAETKLLFLSVSAKNMPVSAYSIIPSIYEGEGDESHDDFGAFFWVFKSVFNSVSATISVAIPPTKYI